MMLRCFWKERISLKEIQSILKKTRYSYTHKDIISFYEDLHRINRMNIHSNILFDIDALPEPVSMHLQKRAYENINKRIKKIESIIDSEFVKVENEDTIDTMTLKSLYDELENLEDIKTNNRIVVKILRP